MTVAVIPARGGSKRIPRKNVKEFAGKPMIAHAIETAQTSKLFEHIVVSTDDEEIADVARQFGALVPFLRPAELADDHTPTIPVIAHALEACSSLGWQLEYACCIYPCVPFLRPGDLVGAFELLQETGASFSFPVTEFPSAVQRGLARAADGKMTALYPEHELTRTQDLPRVYFDTGQFYWARHHAWKTQQRVHSNGAGYLVPQWRVVDIDTPDDWERAQLILSNAQANQFKGQKK